MNSNTKKNSGYYLLLIFPVIMIIFGGIFLAVGLGFNYVKDIKKEHCSEPVTAQVYGYKYQNGLIQTMMKMRSTAKVTDIYRVHIQIRLSLK